METQNHALFDSREREVDFLITQKNKAWLLVECKLSDAQPSAHLAYFKQRLAVPYAVQVVSHLAPGYLLETAPGIYVSSATRFLECLC